MRKAVAIAPARDLVPAHRLLLTIAVAVLALTIPQLAHGQTAKKTTGVSRSPIHASSGKAVAAAPVAAAMNLRAANDTIPAAAKLDPPTGSIRGVAVSPTVGLSANAAIPPRTPVAAPPRAFNREWYPESHGYLRPYHYKWRYWTPG